MKHKYEINYLKTAECDLYGIFDYIKQDNQGAAVDLLERIDRTISSLASNLYSGRIPKDNRFSFKI